MSKHSSIVLLSRWAIVLLALNARALSAGEIPAELLGAWTHTEWQANYGHYDPEKVDQFDYETKTR